MKRLSFNYFQLSKDEEKAIWKDCIFVFDTSTLLDFYFISNESLDDIFTNTFEKVKDRLWIPQHVEFEYLKNRINTLQKPVTMKYKPLEKDIIIGIEKDLEHIKNKIENFQNNLKNRNHHPFISDDGNIIITSLLKKHAEFKENFTQFKLKISEEFSKRIEEINQFATNDKVLAQFEKYLQVGREYTFDELMDIAVEGEKRFIAKIPPGFMDVTNKEGIQKYGDLIIWSQIIEIAKIKQRPVIFILNDNKPDWCYKDDRGGIDRPRHELIKEMKDKSNMRFWMYNLNQFLSKSKELLNTPLKQTSIDESFDIYSDESDEYNLDYGEVINYEIRKLERLNKYILTLFEEINYSNLPKARIKSNNKKIEDSIIEIRQLIRTLVSYKKHFIIDQIIKLSSIVLRLINTIAPETYTTRDKQFFTIIGREDRIENISEKILELSEEIFRDIYMSFD